MDEWFKKYGDIYGIFNGDAPFVLVKDVELLRRVFVSDFGQFVDRGAISKYVDENTAFRNAMSAAHADRWKPIRRCVSQAFTANKMRLLTRPDLLQCLLEMEFRQNADRCAGIPLDQGRVAAVQRFTTRLASSDYRYEGMLLRKGVSVMACSHQVHHDPNLWERPDQFDPDRFSSEQRASRDPLAFQAYGIGPRNCVGMKLAQLEMTLVVAKLVHRFRLQLGSKHENGELKRHTYFFIACPADGVWIRLEKLKDGS
ncbi:hypothetical protein MTO96_037731 [Rhipicephalus appendiculatus]